RQQRGGDRSGRQASDSRGGRGEGSRGGQRQGTDGRTGRSGGEGRGDRGQQRQGADSRGGRGGAPRQGADSRGGSRQGADAKGGRGGSAHGGARPGQGAGASRSDKGRGKNYQEKDRRSRKDQIYNEDEKSRRNKSGRFIRPEKKDETPAEEQIKTIFVPEKISIRELAERMHLQAAEIIKKLFLQGKAMTPNSEVSYDEAEEIALGYDILCEKEQKVDVIEELLREEEEDEAEMVSRPPVVCVMGHVDHGKTSLLDAIRSTSVTSKEAGGITQAIGAYMVSVNGRDITFLDTPGHEAFTAMRMRGANSTDIAILVVAADDGVMPQTIEAINHAKAAGVEIVVAVNKIDKDGANPERVKQQLTEYELIPTEWGGSTEFVEVSAKTGDGIEDLLETILLTADIMELKANPDRKARGLVLEAMLDKGRGPVANVLVQKGTLHIGDFISAGASSGKVRAMIDDKGRRVKEA
ncbi:MAG TPA: translation initiation factor IF-2, partial [Sarcina sp.]|nr:translation initiation factor IF-2 [Sarcina sp.]